MNDKNTTTLKDTYGAAYNNYKKGDAVTIQESKPISKMKSWITYNSSSNIKESETK